MRAATIIAALAGAIVLGHAPAIIAEASAVPCEHRSEAHIAKYGGLWKDSADHIARGELPTCGAEGSSPSESQPQQESKPDEGKSRYCRKHWYC